MEGEAESALDKALNENTKEIGFDTCVLEQDNQDTLRGMAIAGPSSIAILGQLFVLTNEADFSLAEPTPNGGFQHIRRPESFRATLLQVSDEAWSAFNTAHNGMDIIRLSILNVPDILRTISDIVCSPPTDVTEVLLSIKVGELREQATRCSINARKGAETFGNVLKLLQEILQQAVAGAGQRHREVDEAKNLENALRIQKEGLEKIRKLNEAEYKDAKENVARFQIEFKQAMKDIPVGFNAVLQNLGYAVADNLDCLVPLFAATNPISAIGKSIAGKAGEGSGAEYGRVDGSCVFALLLSQVLVEPLTKIVLHLEQKDPTKLVNDSSDVSDKAVGVVVLSLNAMESAKKNDVVNTVLSQAVRIKQFLKKTSDEKLVMDNYPPLVTEGNSLLAELKQLEAARAGLTGMPETHNTTKPAITGNRENERYKAQIQREMLKRAEDAREMRYQEQKELTAQVSAVMQKFKSVSAKRSDLKTVLPLIGQAISLIGQLQIFWKQLVTYFDSISNRAGIAFSFKMSSLMNTFSGYHEKDPGGLQLRKDFVKMITPSIRGIFTEARFLHRESTLYLELSRQVFLPRAASLSGYLSVKGDDDRSAAIAGLEKGLESSKKAATAIIDDKAHRLNSSTEEYRKSLEASIKTYGKLREDEKKAIEAGLTLAAAVKQGGRLTFENY